MIPNVSRGGKMAGLVVYLAGPGRANEHENPHLVAGDDNVLFTVDPGQELSRDDALDIANVLDQPRKIHGTSVTIPVKEYDESAGKKVEVGRREAHVWHCSLSIGVEDGKLTDSQWKNIAQDFVEKMGFIDPDGTKSSRWAAVRHGVSKSGNDHIHLVVQAVREDGTKANLHNDILRAQTIVGELEHSYRLTVLESREVGKGALAGDKKGEQARAEREGNPVSHKDELRRRLHAARAASDTEKQYIVHLRGAGVRVLPRFAEGSTTTVTGYKVGLVPDKSDPKQQVVWYAPSKLDRSLSLTQIRASMSDPQSADAVQTWQGLHNRTMPQATGPAKSPVVSQRTFERLTSGRVGPDTLAGIYAGASMRFEKGEHGPLARTAKNLTRAAQSPGDGAYSHRLMARAAGKDSKRGWMAVMQQARRLATVMARSEFGGDRPGLAKQITVDVADGMRAIEAYQADKTKRPVAAGSEAKPTRQAVAESQRTGGHIPGHGPTVGGSRSTSRIRPERDHGHGR